MIYYNITDSAWEILDTKLTIGRDRHVAFALNKVPEGVCQPA
jgi:hypothetical protein